MNKQRRFREKGITLVALIVTIIILLILAGITIVQLSGENGLFYQTQLAKEKYAISEYKEKLQLEIEALRIEKNSKGEDLTKEDLPKLNSDEIDVGSTESFPVEVICGKYKFNVDKNFVITYIGEADGTIITYTTYPEGYTNQDEVNILIKAINSKGIKTIQWQEDEPIDVNGATEKQINYTVTANETYLFKVIDNNNKEVAKDIVIDKIDKLNPLDFTPTIDEMKSTSLLIIANAQDAESDGTSSKSGIGRYEYYVNGTKYESKENSYKVTGLTKETQYSIYVKAYDKAGNDKQSQTVTATTTSGDYPTLTLNGMINSDDSATDAVLGVCYDGDFTTFDTNLNGVGRSFKINPECWGKYLTIYCESPKDSYGCVALGSDYLVYDKVNAFIGNIFGWNNASILSAKSVLIPDGTYWSGLTSGTYKDSDYTVYEIWCSEDDLTGNVYSNDNRP